MCLITKKSLSISKIEISLSLLLWRPVHDTDIPAKVKGWGTWSQKKIFHRLNLAGVKGYKKSKKRSVGQKVGRLMRLSFTVFLLRFNIVFKLIQNSNPEKQGLARR